MQALYGLKQAEKSDFHLALDFISEVFAPDLNSMEPRDRDELQHLKSLSKDLFRQSFTKDKPNLHQFPDEVRKAVNDATEIFEKSLQKDRKHYQKVMLEETGTIYENYVQSLLFLVELFQYSHDFMEGEKGKRIKTDSGFPPPHNLLNNKLYLMLKDDQEIEKTRVRSNLSWDRDLVKKTFRSNLKGDEEVREYLLMENPGFEDDRKILLYTAKNCIFKNNSLQAVFEESDYNWAENKSIVKNLVVKTLKSAELNTDKLLIEISGNWEEDRQFFEDLYQYTLEKQDELDQYIEEKAQNWEMERIALTDNIIIKMALAEMIFYPGIPVKVSINEYIELSKIYSTPKSKQFVNGMLDALSTDLIKKGVIRKSGRGLIDNK